jgi:hypothetical protein
MMSLQNTDAPAHLERFCHLTGTSARLPNHFAGDLDVLD